MHLFWPKGFWFGGLLLFWENLYPRGGGPRALTKRVLQQTLPFSKELSSFFCLRCWFRCLRPVSAPLAFLLCLQTQPHLRRVGRWVLLQCFFVQRSLIKQCWLSEMLGDQLNVSLASLFSPCGWNGISWDCSHEAGRCKIEYLLKWTLQRNHQLEETTKPQAVESTTTYHKLQSLCCRALSWEFSGQIQSKAFIFEVWHRPD